MFDVTIFTALGWERRAVTEALRTPEPLGPSGAWRGRLADGASCLVVQTGIGPARAAAAAAAAPPAGAFLACGCAGALVGWLVAGDLVTAGSVMPLEAGGRRSERLPAAGACLARGRPARAPAAIGGAPARCHHGRARGGGDRRPARGGDRRRHLIQKGGSMRFPLHIATDMMRWQLKNWWAGNQHVPVVLMLEPLHTCNLACIGCSPERYTGDLKDRLPLSKCFAAVDECGAPVVSVCGGEPTVYPEIVELVEGIIARKKHVIMCTNAILLAC